MGSKWKLAAVVLVGLLSVTVVGCRSEADFQNAANGSRRAMEELQKAQAELLALRQENDGLKKELAARQAELAAKDKIIANLQHENDLLTAELNKLKALLKDRGAQAMPMALPALPKGLTDTLAALAAKYPDLFEFDATKGMLRVKADMTFDPGSTVIKPAALAALKELANVMNSADAQAFSLYIAGHTDDMPLKKETSKAEHRTNWGLSVHRSLAVIQALFTDGISQNRMGALGFSKYHPIAPNAAGNKGNVANRRVEIWILPQDRLLTTDEMGTNSAAEEGDASAAPAAKPAKAIKPAAAAPVAAPEAPAEE